MNMPQIERITFLLIKLFLNSFTEHGDVFPINILAFLNQSTSVIYLDILQLLFKHIPVLFQKEQNLLSPPHSKHRKQTLPSPLDDLFHFGCEVAFSLMSWLMLLGTIGTFYNQNINLDIWQSGRLNVPLLLTRVISSIQNRSISYCNQKHSCTQNMSSAIRHYLYSFVLHCLLEVHSLYSCHRSVDLLLFKQLIRSYFKGVVQEVVVDLLGGVGHKYFSIKVHVFQEVRQGSAVIEVGVCNENEIEGFGVLNFIKDGQSRVFFFAHVQSTIEHDVCMLVFEYDAASADLAACADGHDGDLIHDQLRM